MSLISCSTVPTAEFEPLVLAMTSDRQQVLLASFRDPTHPATLCTISKAAAIVKFISRSDIGYVTSGAGYDPDSRISLVARVNLTDLKPVFVAKVQGQVMDIAWSPDASSVAYLVEAAAGHQLWLKTGSTPPRAITPPIPLYGRGGSLENQVLIGFSHDGKYLLMVDTIVDFGPISPDMAHFQVHSVPDGNRVFVPPARAPTGDMVPSFITMAVWSRQADRLYYRDPAGVHTWDPPSTVGTLALGLAWYSPSVSPDGRFVAYAVNMIDQPHVEVRDLVSNKVQVMPGIRGAPFFVADSILFEAEYAPSTRQGPGSQLYEQTGRAFVIDLRTNVETVVPMVNPIDFWPR